jgi:hypothetical protein
MEPMQLHARVGGDGVLRLEIPFETADAGCDVLVSVEPAPVTAPAAGAAAWGGFLAETFGTGGADSGGTSPGHAPAERASAERGPR